MLKYFSAEALGNIFKQYGEVNFSTQKDGKSIAIEIDNSRRMDKNSFSFKLICDEYRNFYLDGFRATCDESEQAEAEIYIDQYPAVKDEKSRYLIERPCFIYDFPDAPSFIFGFDPHNGDVWQIKSEKGVVIKAKDLTHKFIKRDGSQAGFGHVDFKINSAEFVGIYGGSGTGKTLLLESILAPEYHAKGFIGHILTLLKSKIFDPVKNNIVWLFKKKKEVQSGYVEINSKPPHSVIDEIAYLPQHIDFPDRMTCQEILELALVDRRGSSPQKEIAEKIKLCSIEEALMDRRYKDLSGGQKRRLALAVALLKKNAKLLITDEPTTGLDVGSEEAIMNTLRRISRNGITVITVTHSVAACRIFDRVLVLRKDDKKSGARLVFKSLWTENSFPISLRSQNLRDAELLCRLTDSLPVDPIDSESENEKKEYVWPFADRSPENNHLKKFGYWCCSFGIVTKQIYVWAAIIHKLIFRDIKNLLVFVCLAVICTLTIQIGVRPSAEWNSWDVILLCLLSLVSPWLCATFSAVLSSNYLRFFSWENFSGLKASGFVFGMFLGQLLPALIISGIFSAGLILAPDSKVIAASLLCTSDSISKQIELSGTDLSAGGQKIKTINTNFKNMENINYSLFKDSFDNPSAIKKDLKEISQAPLFIKPMHELLNGIVSNSKEIELPADYKNKELQKNWIFNKDTDNIYKLNYHAVFIYLRVWLGMFIVSLAGVALGIGAASIFRKAQSATLFLVVLFVFYLSFSRMFISEGKEFLAPLTNLQITAANQLDSVADCGILLSIALSFFSVSKYAVNVILSLFFSFAWYDFAVLVIVFALLPLLVSSVLFSNKKKNWKLLSR